MMRLFVLWVAVLSLSMQETTLPQGDYCWTPKSSGSSVKQREKDPHAHRCECHLRCIVDGNGEVADDHEDATCKLYCRREACQCHIEEPCESSHL